MIYIDLHFGFKVYILLWLGLFVFNCKIKCERSSIKANLCTEKLISHFICNFDFAFRNATDLML